MRAGGLVLLLTLLAWSQGCVPAIPLITGPDLSEDSVERIEPGRTTKHQLFEWFGLPMAIGENDELLHIPRPTIYSGSSVGDIRRGGYDDINADTFFELFSSTRQLGDQHRVYYYYRAVSTSYVVIGGLAYYTSSHTQTRRLWVLVDEDRGIVDDYLFRPK